MLRKITEHEKFLDRFHTCMYHLSEPDFINLCFDLFCDMFDHFGLTSQDPRLCLSVKSNYRLPLIIGQRCVAEPRRNGILGLLMPDAFQVYDFARYDPEVVDKYLNRRGGQETKWVLFDFFGLRSFDPFIADLWYEAIEDELRRSSRSSFKRFHNQYYYDVVTDRSLRSIYL